MPFPACGPFASSGTWFERAEASSFLLVTAALPSAVHHRGLTSLGREDLAAADPNLAANRSIGRLGHRHPVVDVGAKRVKRHASFAVPFIAGHLRASQAARAGDPDSLGAKLHPRLHRLLHRPAKGDSPLELGGDVLCYQLSVSLRLAHLDDVQKYLVLGELLKILLDRLDARAALADDDARPGGVHVHLHLVRRTLDLHLRDPRVAERLLDEVADADVLVQPLRVVLLFVPLGVPGLDDSEPEPDRMYLLAHVSSSPRSASASARAPRAPHARGSTF